MQKNAQLAPVEKIFDELSMQSSKKNFLGL